MKNNRIKSFLPLIPRKAVVDTGFLAESFIINYFEKVNKNDYIAKEAEKIFKKGNNYKQKYIRFLNSIAVFITTANVITEANGILKSHYDIQGKSLQELWKSSIPFLIQKQLDENLLKIIELSQNQDYKKIFYEINFIDVGLIELAKRSNLKIVTKDKRTLSNEANNQAVEVIVLQDFFDSWDFEVKDKEKEILK